MALEPISSDAAHAAAVLAKSVEVALQGTDLSPSQYRLLVYLSEEDAAATVLARKLAVTRPSLTSLVDSLAARGLVTREPDPVDRRRVTHRISDAGAAAVADADAAIQRRLEGWLTASLDAEEVAAVNRGLELWLRAIRTAREARAEA